MRNVNPQELRDLKMLEGIELIRLAGARLHYLGERQSVIARNIANANTPGYIGRDLTPFTFDGALTSQAKLGITGSPLALVRTSGDHLDPATTSAAARETATTGYGEKPDGNEVSIEEQMVKAADNTNNFALVSAAYAKSIAIMKMSIDK